MTKQFSLLGMVLPLVLTASAVAADGGSKPERTYVFSHLAGPSPESPEPIDGVGRAARFKRPTGVALDAAGNLIVADAGQHTIRTVSAGGVVTTLAGVAGEPGMVDGLAMQARFDTPSGVAVDAGGHVFVADRGNACIRRISPSGIVTTFAGRQGVRGSLDGVGSTARFEEPVGVAFDIAGNLYVADAGGHTIRKIDPSGYVSTLAGAPGVAGHVDGVGLDARFRAPVGIAVSKSGTVYVTSDGFLRMIDPSGKVSTLPRVVPGVGAFERFEGGHGVAVGAEGRVYVAASGVVRRLEDDGSVSTFAGRLFSLPPNLIDGVGAEAAFGGPAGLAIDAAGNVFVADAGNSAIRRVTPNRETSTIAGGPEEFHVDGPGAVARFKWPVAVALDAAGYAIVADAENGVLRRVSPSGVVTTLAGAPGQFGYVDGLTREARFSNQLGQVAADSTGNVYVADIGNSVVRKVSLAGIVSTVKIGKEPAGVAVDSADNLFVTDRVDWTIRRMTAEGGMDAVISLRGQAYQLGRVAVDRAGNLYVCALHDYYRMSGMYGILKVAPGGEVSLLAGDRYNPNSTSMTDSLIDVFGYPTDLAVDESGSVFVADPEAHVIWRVLPDGEVTAVTRLTGWRSSTDPMPFARPGNENGRGETAWFNSPRGVALDRAGNLYVADTGNRAIRVGVPVWENSDTRLAALSVRSRAGAGDRTLIMGFAVGGGESHDVVVRGLGPTLTDAGLEDVVRDPKLEVFRRGERVAENDDWSEELMPLFARLGAGSPRQGSKDAALLSSLPAGAYTAHVVATGSDDGVALAEVFDAELEGEGRLEALAVRSRAGVGNDVLIAGLVLVGDAPKTVLIRAVGPSLAQQGVSGVLADPRLRLFRGNEEIDRNDDWGGTAWLKKAFAEVGLGGFESDSSKDAALLVSLEPGVYTVHVSGKDGATGVGLVEVYAVE